MPYTKQYIQEQLKKDNNDIADLIANASNVGDLILVLENLGHLPKSFDYKILIPLLNNDNDAVRALSLKNLGKLRCFDLLPLFVRYAKEDRSTDVRREAVSCIGRLRIYDATKVLKEFLKVDDPKIVCQAIRGLLVFKGVEDIDATLVQMKFHPNEMVQKVIQKEYFSSKDKKRSSIPHKDTYPFLKNVVVNGDVRDVIKYVPDESIHLTFTSPPYYNARDYSIYPSYEEYLNFLEQVFAETHRITKEGRFLIVNTSPVIVPRISRAHSSKRYPIPFDIHNFLIKMGWEFIDDIIWMKPEYSVKNRVGGFQQHRKPLGYKPNAVTEYLMVYRKATDKLLDWNMHQYDAETVADSKVPDGFDTTNVWQICPQSDKVHSAIFPVDLCRRVIQYYSYKGDIVFDPFGGSGTLGRTAKSMGRLFFLTEKEPRYFEYMKTFQKKGDDLKEDQPTKFLTLEEFIKTTK